MKTAKQILNEFCDESNRYPTKEEALLAMRSYAESVKEEAAKIVARFEEEFVFDADATREQNEAFEEYISQENLKLNEISSVIRSIEIK